MRGGEHTEGKQAGEEPGERNCHGLPLVALFATRADRPLRTRAFSDWLAEDDTFSLCCPVGGHALYAAGRLRSRRVKTLPGIHFSPGPEGLLRTIRENLREFGLLETGGEFLLAGIGNMHGYGERFRAYTAGCME